MRLSKHHEHAAVVSPNPSGATALVGLLLLAFCLVPLSQPRTLMHWFCAAVFAFSGLAWIYRGWPQRVTLQRTRGGVEVAGQRVSSAAVVRVRQCAERQRYQLELHSGAGDAPDAAPIPLGASRSIQRVSQVAVELAQWLDRPLSFDSTLAVEPKSIPYADSALPLAVPTSTRRVAWSAIAVTLALGLHTLHQFDMKVAELGAAHPLSLVFAWAAIVVPLLFGAALLQHRARIDGAARWIEWRVFGIRCARRHLPAVLPRQLAWLSSSAADVLHCVVLWPTESLVLTVDADDAPRLAACLQREPTLG